MNRVISVGGTNAPLYSAAGGWGGRRSPSPSQHNSVASPVPVAAQPSVSSSFHMQQPSTTFVSTHSSSINQNTSGASAFTDGRNMTFIDGVGGAVSVLGPPVESPASAPSSGTLLPSPRQPLTTSPGVKSETSLGQGGFAGTSSAMYPPYASHVNVGMDDELNADPFEDNSRVIGQVKSQWNSEPRLMQLLSLLYEVHTFGDAHEVPEKVWEGVAKSIFEVENVVLNRFLIRMTSAVGRSELIRLVRSWKMDGPGVDFYITCGELLDRVADEETAGEVYPTYLHSVWEYLGLSSRLPWLAWSYVAFIVLWVLCTVSMFAVAVSPAENRGTILQSMAIAMSPILFLTSALMSVIGLAVAHHNAVMHGIVNFIEVQRLKELVPTTFASGAVNNPVASSAGPHSEVSSSVAHGVHAGPPSIGDPTMTMVVDVPGTDPAGGQLRTTGSGRALSTHNGVNLPVFNQSHHPLDLSVGGAVHPPNGHVHGNGSGTITRRAGASMILGMTSASVGFGAGRFSNITLGFTQHGDDDGVRSVANVGLQSTMHLGSVLGMSVGPSQLGSELEHARALVLCKSDGLLHQICKPLWSRRIGVTCFTDVKEFATAAVRIRNPRDRFRLCLIVLDDLTESEYAIIKPMEESQGVAYCTAGNPADVRFVTPSIVKTIPFSGDDVERFVLSQAQQGGAAAAVAAGDLFRPVRQFHVPHYTIGRRLGGGAFGNVFEAELDVLEGRCAVKRIYIRPDEINDRLANIAREVEIMCRLTHPNICQYLFCKREGNCVCIFMEICEGGSLKSIIQRRELNADQAKQCLRQIIDAVRYLHSRGLVHHDLKPENVLFRNGQVKLSDFGTASKPLSNTNQGLSGTSPNRSEMKGTFPYMAPEVLLQEAYGFQCDVWSIGCITAEVLGIPLDHRSLGLASLREFYQSLNMMMAIDVEVEEDVAKDFLELCFRRDPAQRPTPSQLLEHPLLRHDDGTIRRLLDGVAVRARSLRRPSLGVQSLKSQAIQNMQSNSALHSVASAAGQGPSAAIAAPPALAVTCATDDF